MPNSYRLYREINAIISVSGESQVLPIPAGSIITVTEPEPPIETGLVTVAWEDQIVEMFAIDVKRRSVPLEV